MVWNAQDAEEKQESKEISRHGFCYNFSCAILFVTENSVFNFSCAILFVLATMIIYYVWIFVWSLVYIFTLVFVGPTSVIDFLFFWKKRQALRKQLISTSVPVELHIVHRRQENGFFFVGLGYLMDNNVPYFAKNEEEVTKQMFNLTETKSTEKIRIVWHAGGEERSLIWKNGKFLVNVSSSYPSSGPCYPECFSTVCGLFLFGLFFAAFEISVLGFLACLFYKIAGARTICVYFAVAGVLFFIGFLISACKFVLWRNTTLHGYVECDYERLSTMIDDYNDNDVDENNDGLEMGKLAVQEDDDTEFFLLNNEYLRTMIN